MTEVPECGLDLDEWHGACIGVGPGVIVTKASSQVSNGGQQVSSRGQVRHPGLDGRYV